MERAAILDLVPEPPEDAPDGPRAGQSGSKNL